MRSAAIQVAHPITRINGQIAPNFEEVRAQFERNFAERGEIGAAVAASVQEVVRGARR